jgi:hypothetical protein
MMTANKGYLRCAVGLICLMHFASRGSAQDLDPRAYASLPIGVTLFVAGFSYSSGAVVTDATSPIQDFKATVATPSLAGGHTFSLFGQTAQAVIALPYSWAHASALVKGQDTSTSRTGFADMRLRVSMLLIGAPALTIEEFAKAPRQTIVGTSLTIIPPTGQYFPEKLINLGTNRWAFKPEIAVSQPLDDHWLLDVYAGAWFFTTNNSYYPGTVVRTQDPLLAFQAHISYNVQPMMWAAFDMTFYAGGLSYANGASMGNRQENMRIGGTLVLPVGNRHSVKLAGSTGAIVRFGASFTTVAIAWQTSLY